MKSTNFSAHFTVVTIPVVCREMTIYWYKNANDYLQNSPRTHMKQKTWKSQHHMGNRRNCQETGSSAEWPHIGKQQQGAERQFGTENKEPNHTSAQQGWTGPVWKKCSLVIESEGNKGQVKQLTNQWETLWVNTHTHTRGREWKADTEVRWHGAWVWQQCVCVTKFHFTSFGGQFISTITLKKGINISPDSITAFSLVCCVIVVNCFYCSFIWITLPP